MISCLIPANWDQISLANEISVMSAEVGDRCRLPVISVHDIKVLQDITCMMMSSNRNIFCITGLLCREFTGHWWIPRTKASDAELWCFLWSAPEPTVEQTMERWWFEMPLRLLWCHCNGLLQISTQFGQFTIKVSFQYGIFLELFLWESSYCEIHANLTYKFVFIQLSMHVTWWFTGC